MTLNQKKKFLALSLLLAASQNIVSSGSEIQRRDSTESFTEVSLRDGYTRQNALSADEITNLKNHYF